MNDLVLIIDSHTVTLNPPIYGQYLMKVESVLYKSKSDYNKGDKVVHLCVDNSPRLTICNNITQSAIYTLIKGHQVWESSTSVEHFVDIKEPMSLYFTDKNGGRIESNTPIIKMSLKLIKKTFN